MLSSRAISLQITTTSQLLSARLCIANPWVYGARFSLALMTGFLKTARSDAIS